MKTILVLPILLLSFTAGAQTFDEWFKQDKTQIKYLLLQIAKLQLHLQKVSKGYHIVKTGLTTIGDIKEGDLALHRDLFKRLQGVNPAVQRSHQVREISTLYAQLLAAAKHYKKQLRASGVYDATELAFLQKMLQSVLDKATDDVREVVILVTTGLEMNDSERLHHIAKIHESLDDRRRFLISFCQQRMQQAAQRKRELSELRTLHKQY